MTTPTATKRQVSTLPLTSQGLQRSRRRRDLISVALLPTAVVVAGFGGAAVAVAEMTSFTVIAALFAVTVVALTTKRFGWGVPVGLLVLGAVDALPGPNVEKVNVFRTVHLQDVIVVLLIIAIAASVAANFHSSSRTAGPYSRYLKIWGLVFLALWAVAAVRAWLMSGVPLFNAMFWGRDFLYLAVLAPAFGAAFRNHHTMAVALMVCAVGACIVAVGQILAVAGHHQITFLVHTTNTAQVSGLSRIYSGADDLVLVSVPFGLGRLLLGDQGGGRVLAAVVLVLSLAAVMLELTRARYVGLVVGIMLCVIVWFMIRDSAAELGRRKIYELFGVVGCVVVLLVLYQPSAASSSAVDGVAQRVFSTFTDFSSANLQQSTISVRQRESSELFGVLGASWVFGLGFLDPSYHYVVAAPVGSIRNPDVGYLNVVMTMGVVGGVIEYLPFIGLIVALVVYRLRRHRAAIGWRAFSSAASLATVVISSTTLVVMFSPTGVVICAVVLAIAAITCDAAAEEGFSERDGSNRIRTASVYA